MKKDRFSEKSFQYKLQLNLHLISHPLLYMNLYTNYGLVMLFDPLHVIVSTNKVMFLLKITLWQTSIEGPECLLNGAN